MRPELEPAPSSMALSEGALHKWFDAESPGGCWNIKKKFGMLDDVRKMSQCLDPNLSRT